MLLKLCFVQFPKRRTGYTCMFFSLFFPAGVADFISKLLVSSICYTGF